MKFIKWLNYVLFKKETVTNLEYGFTSVEREKPIKVKKDEHFGVCNGLNCMAYDGGICKMMKGNR